MEKVLFTRQRHEADRAGLHWDYRLVIGDKAHSWATKKELPEPGKSIMLWQQPVHTAHYALSDKVVIPAGQYGAGTTTLDWVKKGTAEMEKDKIVINTDDGRFLLKKMPNYEDGSGWLFRNLGKKDMEKKSTDEAVINAAKKLATIGATGTVGGTVSAYVGRHLDKKDKEKKLEKKAENKYLEKIAMNRGTKYVVDKTIPVMKNMWEHAPKEEQAKGIAALKNSAKMSIRNGTGGIPSPNKGSFKKSFK